MPMTSIIILITLQDLEQFYGDDRVAERTLIQSNQEKLSQLQDVDLPQTQRFINHFSPLITGFDACCDKSSKLPSGNRL